MLLPVPFYKVFDPREGFLDIRHARRISEPDESFAAIAERVPGDDGYMLVEQ